MARKPRVYSENGMYHIILRGNNKQNLFLDDKDRMYFLQKMKKYSKELEIDIYCYCLMTNHVHILIGKAGVSLSLFVQKLANSYVFYFNRKYERSGHLFQGRFKSEPITDEAYFKTVYRYILHNCEKAGLGRYNDYKWNSYEYLNGNSTGKSFVNSQYVIGVFSSELLVKKYLSQKMNDQCMEYENKFVMSDEKALKLIKRLFRVSSPYKLERLQVDDQRAKCKILKEKGLSINQISRITGISKGIIKIA